MEGQEKLVPSMFGGAHLTSTFPEGAYEGVDDPHNGYRPRVLGLRSFLGRLLYFRFPEQAPSLPCYEGALSETSLRANE